MDTTFNIIQTKFATVGAYFLIIVHAAGSASAASTMPHFSPAYSVCSDSFKEYLGIPKLLLRSTRFLFGNEHDRENRGGTTTTAWS
jgi:hypothetical protein